MADIVWEYSILFKCSMRKREGIGKWSILKFNVQYCVRMMKGFKITDERSPMNPEHHFWKG